MTDYPSGSVQSAINEHIEESKDSTTPLVWIEGTGVKRINLNILPFLKKEKQMLEEDLRNTKKQIESLSREIARVK